MDIQYELTGFHPSTGFKNQKSLLKISSPELLHAAITVGRRNWQDVYCYPYYSEQEVNFRYHMINAFLKFDNGQVSISEAYKTLDPSEKGGINYFIGSVFTKIFAERLFDTPWLMHLDVYKHNLYNSVALSYSTIRTSNSRPDFVGIDTKNNYNVFEAKGRSSFSNDALDKAHDQSKKLKSINGSSPKLMLGCVTFHNENDIRMKIKDPEDFDKDAVHLKILMEEFYFDYYASTFHFINGNDYEVLRESGIDFYITSNRCKDFRIGMEKRLFEILRDLQYDRNQFHNEFYNTILFDGKYKVKISEINDSSDDKYIGGDGIIVKFK